MEKRINKKADTYLNKFKTDIHSYIEENTSLITEEKSALLQYVFDYNGICFTKEDFQKRKRVKNTVPHFERCKAKRANGEQCTRRKKDNDDFCGTHVKGTPHGMLETNVEAPTSKSVTVWAEEIKGIHYYLDDNHNVYKHEDIIANKENPKIIHQWVTSQNGTYEIPGLNI
jgi:hypothetical protein